MVRDELLAATKRGCAPSPRGEEFGGDSPFGTASAESERITRYFAPTSP